MTLALLRTLRRAAFLRCLALVCLFALPLRAEPIDFDLPAQSADRALLAFAKQANVDVLFSFDALRAVQSNAVIGRLEIVDAIERLLRGTGFVARRSGDAKWVITPTGPPAGTIKGKILAPDGSPARRVRVTVTPTNQATQTSDEGEFEFAVPPGRYRLFVAEPNYRPLQITNATVPATRTLTLEPQTLQRIDDPTRMEPFVVEGRAARAHSLDHSEAPLGPRTAGGNLDLNRTESDALPYMIFNRTQIARSGVVNLNEFLQRELIDSNPAALPPEQNGGTDTFRVGSSNLQLRGFNDDETIILINGRPLPEVMLSGLQNQYQPPDVNFIPLSLVQQVEVLPVSAASVYSGNAVGGVINIVLRPDVDANASEVTATYTNSLGHYDAPQSALSLLHTQTLLKGALRLRLNATFSYAMPPTEAELGYHQRRAAQTDDLFTTLHRATPNVRSIPGPTDTAPPPLFGPGTSSVTSVAPQADGNGGIAAFRGREGMRNFDFFNSPGGLSTSSESLDFPYGRQQRRAIYYGSAVYDVRPWLQLAADGTYSNTVMHRGYDVFPLQLKLLGTSPMNPFGRDVEVTLSETAPALGEHYSEARLEFGSVVLSGIVKVADWQITLDAQYAHNIARYRGISHADTTRLQSLVDQGVYNPLRDTQVFAPPPAFYDQVLVYRGGYGRFVTMGNYQTLDLALRATNESLHLPTGDGVINLGTDFRRNSLAKYNDERRYRDGTLAGAPMRWDSRTLTRYSFFGELRAPLYPVKRLPGWLHRVEGDLALRYVAAGTKRESNFAPTYGMKVALAGGVSLRGSVSTSNRDPTPQLSRPLATPSETPGGGNPDLETIYDPVRREWYGAAVTEVLNPDLRPDAAVTQTAGVIFEHGQTHRFRAAVDFVDTHKVNEITFLDRSIVLAGESLWPERVQRAPLAPGDNAAAGRILQIITSRVNLASRYSQDWTASLDYRWNACFGGTFEAYSRVLYFQRYVIRTLPNSPRVDELRNPDGLIPLLRYRANAGVSWSNKACAFGGDTHYFHSRLLPLLERPLQGHDRVRPYWQFDLFAQTDVAHWLPWYPAHRGLRLQARVNNVLNAPFPKDVNNASTAAVQPYGDWRGRVYSLSLTATF